MNKINSYKIINIDDAVTPNVTVIQQVGTSYASHSGTPSKRGVWRVLIQAFGSDSVADVMEVEQANDSRRVAVAASGSYALIPGVTVTLSGTINDGDIFDVAYSMYVPDIA